jgi:hypothetical protein
MSYMQAGKIKLGGIIFQSKTACRTKLRMTTTLGDIIMNFK